MIHVVQYRIFKYICVAKVFRDSAIILKKVIYFKIIPIVLFVLMAELVDASSSSAGFLLETSHMILVAIISFCTSCPCGGIGRRAGFKIQFLREWGFDSPRGYKIDNQSVKAGFKSPAFLFYLHLVKQMNITNTFSTFRVASNLKRMMAKTNTEGQEIQIDC